MLAIDYRMATVIFAMLAGLVGCQASMSPSIPQASSMRMLEDESEMKEEVLARVPIGTSIEDAQQRMVECGYECTRRTDENSAQEYLYCDKSESSSLFVGKRWQISLWFDQVGVRDVTVACGSVGL